MKKFNLTVVALLLAGASALAGTRMDIVNAPCKTISEALAFTLQQDKKPFSVGGAGEESFDNPGLVTYTFKKLGIDVPNDMITLSKTGKSITKIAKLMPGDIVFFFNPENKKEIVKMGIVQSLASETSFTFFYADQKQGVVRIVHSSEDEFNGHFKQASRLVTDKEIADVRNEHTKETANIEKAKNSLTKAQAAATTAENELKNLQNAFEQKNTAVFSLK